MDLKANPPDPPFLQGSQPTMRSDDPVKVRWEKETTIFLWVLDCLRLALAPP
jgi:hypothetical protein